MHLSTSHIVPKGLVEKAGFKIREKEGIGNPSAVLRLDRHEEDTWMSRNEDETETTRQEVRMARQMIRKETEEESV